MAKRRTKTAEEIKAIENDMLDIMAPMVTGFQIWVCETEEDRDVVRACLRDEMAAVRATFEPSAESMPKDFSAEDRFRARGMGVRLD